jgi:hypothetical protein
MLSVANEPVLNDELTETLWLDRPPVTGLKTTDGLLEIIENAVGDHGCRVAKGKAPSGGTGAVPRRLCHPRGVLLSVYFADAGNTGSSPTSRSSCWMMTVALRLAAIFLKRSSEPSVWVWSVLNTGTPLVS